MQELNNGVDLVLIAENPNRAAMLRDTMRNNGINGIIRRLAPGASAVDCARKTGTYQIKDLPDLILFDYSAPDELNTAVLRDIAFSNDKARVPVVLLTSPISEDLLETGDIDDDSAVMFSPTTLVSFIRKMKGGKRKSFFKALDTLYQYGPILVRTPDAFLGYEQQRIALSA